MQIKSGFADTVGNTPLIRMRRLSEETGCEILGKAEFMNPGGSVKDRAALWMVREHEKSGALKAGGTVDRGEIVSTTTALIQQEFVKTIEGVVAQADAEAVAETLLAGGK